MRETTTTMSNTTQDYEPVLAPHIEKAAGSLVKIGKLWAKHGLTIGQSALDASAESLSIVSGAIGSLKSKVESVGEPAK